MSEERSRKGIGGRPRKEIDWKEVDKLALIQCTHTEVADWFGCHFDTLNNACKREHGVSFSEYFGQKLGKGKVSLRRRMWLNANDNNNTTMQIWLSKNYLGMTDKRETEITTKDPIQITYEPHGKTTEAPVEPSDEQE